MPATIPELLYIGSFDIQATLWGRFYYTPNFTHDEAKAQRG